MFRHFLLFGWVISIVAATVLPLTAASFVAPADGPVPFRRDRLPLEPWMMREMGQKLVIMASLIRDQQAESKRAQAQMLALSMAVDPGNGKARRSVQSLVKGGELSVEDPKVSKAAPNRIREWLSWLNQEEAGSDAMELAACLKDVLLYAEGGAGDGLKEFGNWLGWIPELSAYQHEPVNVLTHNDPVDASLVGPDQMEPSDPAVTVPRHKFQFSLKSAQMMTPMWQMVGSHQIQGWDLVSCPLTVTGMWQADDQGQPFTLRIGPAYGPVPMDSLQARLVQLLSKQHDPLPNGLQLDVNSSELVKSLNSGMDQSISATVAVLASAIITERKPVAMVIGVVNPNGRTRNGTHFWSKLRSLKKGQGERLVLSSDAEEYLDGLLTIRDLEFFFDHEVYFAKDYDEMLKYSLEGGGESVAKASEKFKVVQQTAKGQTLQQFVMNVYVRKRLEEILADDPNHASARMLLKISNNKRLNTVSTRVMASELLRILRPALQVSKVQHYEILWQNKRLPDLRAMEKQIDDAIAAFHLHVSRDERDWLDQAKKMADQVRALDRAIQSKSEDRSAEVYDECNRLSQLANTTGKELERMANR